MCIIRSVINSKRQTWILKPLRLKKKKSIRLHAWQIRQPLYASSYTVATLATIKEKQQLFKNSHLKYSMTVCNYIISITDLILHVNQYNWGIPAWRKGDDEGGKKRWMRRAKTTTAAVSMGWSGPQSSSDYGRCISADVFIPAAFDSLHTLRKTDWKQWSGQTLAELCG